MPQTLLGVLALMMAALLAFGQQRVTIQSYETRIRDEYSVAAAGLLTEIMELIAARSYDEASTPDWIFEIQRLPTVADFTPPEHFGRYSPLPGQGRGLQKGIERKRDDGFTCDLLVPVNTPLCNDVDDVAGIVDQLIEVTLGNGRHLRFKVSAQVEYVNDFDTSLVVPHQTYNKLVRLRASSPDLPNRDRIAELKRVVAYDPVKAEAEYELLYGPFVEM
jgi:hypothetical protein